MEQATLTERTFYLMYITKILIGKSIFFYPALHGITTREHQKTDLTEKLCAILQKNLLKYLVMWLW